MIRTKNKTGRDPRRAWHIKRRQMFRVLKLIPGQLIVADSTGYLGQRSFNPASCLILKPGERVPRSMRAPKPVKCFAGILCDRDMCCDSDVSTPA